MKGKLILWSIKQVLTDGYQKYLVTEFVLSFPTLVRPLMRRLQNVNTVDVIFPAWPVLLYTNPTLGKYLLEGLFRYQASGLYPNKWSVHDLGKAHNLLRFKVYVNKFYVRF
jgi:hypothetical protein